MSAGKIVRFPGTQPQRRAGRKTAREAYRRTQPQRAGRRISARVAYRRSGAPRQGGRRAGSDLKLLPAIDKDSAGMATDYAVRLAPYEIARIRLEAVAPDHYWIDWVYVPPAHRGQGVAAQLLARVVADADAEGVRLSLEPRACGGHDQPALEGWYRKKGFVDTGRRGELGWIFTRPARPAAGACARRAA